MSSPAILVKDIPLSFYKSAMRYDLLVCRAVDAGGEELTTGRKPDGENVRTQFCGG
jgi:hypothetical protein